MGKNYNVTGNVPQWRLVTGLCLLGVLAASCTKRGNNDWNIPVPTSTVETPAADECTGLIDTLEPVNDAPNVYTLRVTGIESGTEGGDGTCAPLLSRQGEAIGRVAAGDIVTAICIPEWGGGSDYFLGHQPEDGKRQRGNSPVTGNGNAIFARLPGLLPLCEGTWPSDG